MDRSPCDPLHCLNRPQDLAREILSVMREPFLVLDGDARVLAATDQFLLRFGLSTDEVLGRPIALLGRGEWNLPELRDLFARRAREADRVEDHEVVLRSALQPSRPLRLDVRVLRGAGGGVERFLVSVTEPAPRAQSAPDRLLRLASEHSADLLALYGADGVCRYVSASCEAILGYSSEDLRRLSPCALLLPPDRERLTEAVEQLHEQMPPRRLLLRARRRDGRRVWLETLIRIARDPDGTPLLHATARDVTDRERAEEALRWTARQNRAILDGAAEGILGVDAAGVITFANPAAARTLRVPASELVGCPYDQLLHREDGRQAPGAVAATLADGVARTASDAHLRRRGAPPIPVELCCTPLRVGSRLAGAVVTFRDLTERRLGDAARRHANWLSGVQETAVALRHEVSAPLTTLLAEAALLDMGGHTAEEQREMVGAMVVAARRIGDVVRRLADTRPDGAAAADSAPAAVGALAG